MVDLIEHLQKTAQTRAKPTSEYEFYDGLIDSELRDEEKRGEMLLKFSQIVDKHVQLANIGSDVLLRLYQNDSAIMCDWLDMSSREPFIAHVFAPIYFAWRGELLLTNTKEGKFLSLLGRVGKGQGLGQTGSFGTDEAYSQEEVSIFDKLLNRGKK